VNHPSQTISHRKGSASVRVALDVLGLSLFSLEVDTPTSKSQPPGYALVRDEDGDLVVVSNSGGDFQIASAADGGDCDDDDCEECNTVAKKVSKKSAPPARSQPFGFSADE
jgi:hypothetical protein